MKGTATSVPSLVMNQEDIQVLHAFRSWYSPNLARPQSDVGTSAHENRFRPAATKFANSQSFLPPEIRPQTALTINPGLAPPQSPTLGFDSRPVAAPADPTTSNIPEPKPSGLADEVLRAELRQVILNKLYRKAQATEDSVRLQSFSWDTSADELR
jgi:hypothetical protein